MSFLPNAVGRFLTCPYPHAEIVSMDTSEAEIYPGVRGVLRYDDPELPVGANLGGHEPSDLPPLPRIAHFQGEEVGAFIVADSEEIAEQALKLVKVEGKERPFVLDPEEALKPGAPIANPESSEAISPCRYIENTRSKGFIAKQSNLSGNRFTT
jgi:CO/xanthine dehydrogenase Mo-binding subunit